MDRYRFYLPNLHPGLLELPADQAHHALHVLRLQTGAVAEVFDGKGSSGIATLDVSKRTVRAHVKDLQAEPPPPILLTLATAVPKADRAEWLVEQASQLNAFAIQWIDAERSVVKPREGGNKMEKFQRLAIESAKQCGRNWLLDVRAMRPAVGVGREAVGRGEMLLLLDPKAPAGIPEIFQRPTPQIRITALIGPEGGWSPEESALLMMIPGIVPVRIGQTILRIETACAAISTLVGSITRPSSNLSNPAQGLPDNLP